MPETEKVTVENLIDHLLPMGVEPMEPVILQYVRIQDRTLAFAVDYRHPLGRLIPPLHRLILPGREQSRSSVDHRPRLWINPQLQTPRDDAFALIIAHAMYLWPLAGPSLMRVGLAGPGLVLTWLWPGTMNDDNGIRVSSMVHRDAIQEAVDAVRTRGQAGMDELAHTFVMQAFGAALEEMIQRRGIAPSRDKEEPDDLQAHVEGGTGSDEDADPETGPPPV